MEEDEQKLNFLVAYDTGGATDTAAMTDENDTLHLTVEFIPGISSPENPDITRVALMGVTGVDEIINVVFEKKCTPGNPVYLRWVNDLGGFEYQMFDQHKEYETEAAGIVDFFPSFDDTENVTRTREVLNLTGAKRTIAAGMEQLARDEFDVIAGITVSPRIDMWDTITGKWQGVTLDGNTRTTWDTHHSRGAIELVLRLAEMQLQF